MLNIKLSSTTSDFSFDRLQTAHVYGADENYLRSYNDFKRRDLAGWYLIEVAPYCIWVSNECYSADETAYVCVCLDCGHKSIQLYNYCEKCQSAREPVYLEV